MTRLKISTTIFIRGINEKKNQVNEKKNQIKSKNMSAIIYES